MKKKTGFFIDSKIRNPHSGSEPLNLRYPKFNEILLSFADRGIYKRKGEKSFLSLV
jgi:hypothetical protein